MVEERKILRFGKTQDAWSGNLVWEPMPVSYKIHSHRKGEADW